MRSSIPVNIPSLTGNELKYVSESVESGWISSEGPFVKSFEEKFSKYIGRDYGVAVANGSGALDIAVQALDIGQGDEVIMPTFTIASPAFSVVRAGATPVLVDTEPEGWTMDVTQIEQKITPRTKAIIVVHIYGLPANMNAIEDIARRHRLVIIEDAAEMIGQKFENRLCGSFGDISVFSFYANKHVTTGEGGMLLTSNRELAERCAKLRNLAFERDAPRFVHYEMGWNYRMTNLQAAVGAAQLEQLNYFLEKKQKMGAFYQSNLSFLVDKGFQLPLKKNDYSTNVYWVFGIVAPDETTLKELTTHLTNEKIGWRPFFWCMHEQPVFKKQGLFRDEKYPVAEALARRGFYIPGGLGLSTEEQERVCSVINDFFRHNG